MRSSTGRLLRVVLGIVMIWSGFFGGGGIWLGLLGFVPLLAGGVNACLLAPAFGYSIWGDKKATHTN